MKRDILVTLAWLFMGCGARVGGAGSAAPDTSDAAPAAQERGGAEDGGGPGVGPSDAHTADDPALPASDLARGPTVWVGQSDQIVTFPVGYDGGTVVPFPWTPLWVTGPEKVVLILDAETNPVIGTITFGGVGPPPPATDPKQPYPPAPTTFLEPDGRAFPLLPENWLQSPFPGFSYSLAASTLSGNLLQLAFVTAQLWQGWCAIQDSSADDASISSNVYDSPCVCDGGACTATSSPMRYLTLTISGDSMQGQLLSSMESGSANGPAEIRLQRVQ